MVYFPLNGGILSSFLGKISRAPSGSDGCFFNFLLILQVIPQRFSGIPRTIGSRVDVETVETCNNHWRDHRFGKWEISEDKPKPAEATWLKHEDRIYRFTMANQPTLP